MASACGISRAVRRKPNGGKRGYQKRAGGFSPARFLCPMFRMLLLRCEKTFRQDFPAGMAFS
ncbi:hypothetical protein P262_03491 [Cronobacter malonaticus]|uniref:Uncharacterized protein n=1 Tax=Cronobacter malonaticus TaxID=413503 RepID=V5U0F3_9ENTR|nr:hypothetical protein P262_03491 [Cronobacter malonaticus]